MITNNLIFNLFSFSGLILGLVSVAMAVLLLVYGKTTVHRILSFFNIALAVWGFGAFNIGKQTNPHDALIAWKIAFSGVILIAVFFYHGMSLFVRKEKPRFLIFAYVQAAIFLCLNFTDLYIDKVSFLKDSIFYLISPSVWFSTSFIIWTILVAVGFIEVLMYFYRSEGIKRRQASYILFGFGTGFLGGITNFCPVYGINIIPFGNVTIPIYTLILTYAILKYKILDLRLAITRAGIFIFVYALVLGIPFWIGFKILGAGKWLIPTAIGTFFASIGPFIYLYIQKSAEEKILSEQKRVHNVIKKASTGMVGIREMSKLLNVLTKVLKDNLRLEYISVYLFDPVDNLYILKVSKPENQKHHSIVQENALVKYLKLRREPISYEEILHLKDNQKGDNNSLEDIAHQMHQLSASVIVPALKKDDTKEDGDENAYTLLSFIVLGKRVRNESFSSESLEVLKVVGNEFALAIEIILSLIERDKLLNENFEIRRFESLGLLCNSMSHQVNNRFQSIVNLLLNPLDIFSEGKYKEASKEELMELLEDFANSAKKIDGISKEGGRITKDILNFSRGKMEVGVVKFDDVVEKSINFLEQKHLRFKPEIKREYPKDILIWGSELNIKDLIYNALDNSCFSLQTKQERGGEYKPVITIRGRANETMFHFDIEDNGIGIKKEDLHKVMDPMFTTKGHNKGSGMGTTFMQQIVQKHGGTIAYESEWDQWARVRISLPLATKEQKGE